MELSFGNIHPSQLKFILVIKEVLEDREKVNKL